MINPIKVDSFDFLNRSNDLFKYENQIDQR